MNKSTIVIESDLYEAIKLMIEMKIIEAETVGAYVEELLQRELRRNKMEKRPTLEERRSRDWRCRG